MDDNKIKICDKVPKFYNNLKLTEKKIWDSLTQGVIDRRSFFHTPTLGTVNRDNKVKIRTLVLREVSKKNLYLRFHTDIRSKKINEIKSNSSSTVHIYDPIQKIQIQMIGISSLCSDEDSIEKIWKNMNISSKACYRLIAQPGETIKNISEANYPLSCDPLAGKSNFSIIFFKIVNIEWLYLSSRGHRRSLYDYSGALVKAKWLAP